MSKFVYSGSPHVTGRRTTKGIMLDVVIALLPATVVGCVYFGWKALLIVAIAVLTAVLTEVLYRMIFNRETFKEAIKIDFSSVVTGLLIGLNLGVQVAWYVPVFASVFAIAVTKMLFGGTGRNLFNPAIAGRIFVFISFLSVMTKFDTLPGGAELVGATPLGNLLAEGSAGVSNLDLFLGRGVAGCIGETCKAALIAGGLYLVARRVINGLYPLIYIAVAGLFTVALKGSFSYFLPTILSGGLMLGAIFMATDYVTTPNTFWGNVLYFAMLGLLTAGLRLAAEIETVSFSILIMNIICPLIDRYIVPRPFGKRRERNEQEAKA